MGQLLRFLMTGNTGIFAGFFGFSARRSVYAFWMNRVLQFRIPYAFMKMRRNPHNLRVSEAETRDLGSREDGSLHPLRMTRRGCRLGGLTLEGAMAGKLPVARAGVGRNAGDGSEGC